MVSERGAAKSGMTKAVGLMAALACLAGFAGPAQAWLISFETYAVNQDGSLTQTYYPTGVGDTVTVRTYALLPDSQADTGLITFTGSMVSASVSGRATLLGDLATLSGTSNIINSAFTAAGADNGTANDLGDPSADRRSWGSPDGDMDIGKGGSSPFSRAGFIILTTNNPFANIVPTSAAGDPTNSIPLYQTVFTVTAAPEGSATLIEMLPRYASSGPQANKISVYYNVDGTLYRENGDDLDMSVGGVLVYTPEPATLALLAAGAAALLARRRRG